MNNSLLIKNIYIQFLGGDYFVYNLRSLATGDYFFCYCSRPPDCVLSLQKSLSLIGML